MEVDPAKLTRADARRKCRLGQGAAQCTFLDEGDPEFSCAFIDAAKRDLYIEHVDVRSAKGRSCVDPTDPYATSRPPFAAPVAPSS